MLGGFRRVFPTNTVNRNSASTPRSLVSRAAFRRSALVFCGFVGLTLLVQRASLQGPFISDDFKDIVNNPFLGGISAPVLVEIVHPWGDAKHFTANYAPVHLLAHMAERFFFGNEMLGYHVVNVCVHALNATLLMLLLERSRVPRTAALLGAAFFALHPANVEAVAWISQLKTNGALAFSLGALLALRRRRALAAILFAFGLLTKTSAVAALPMAAAFVFVQRGSKRDWRSLAVWCAIFVAYSIPQLDTYAGVAAYEVPAYADPLVQARSILAFWMRYLAMGVCGYGLSAFHEPAYAISALDPWWLGGLAATGLLGFRTIWCLLHRREEAAYWLGAAAGFGPVSQLFPFLYPLGDRYLYFILPGLIGGTLLWGLAILARLETAYARGRVRFPPPRLVAIVSQLGVIFALIVFAGMSAQRARLWVNEQLLLDDAVANYPEGETAAYRHACEAGRSGDVERALAELQRVSARGVYHFDDLLAGSCFTRVREDPEFREYAFAQAQRWLDEAETRGVETQATLRSIAHTNQLLGRYQKARVAYTQALKIGGPLQQEIRHELAALQDLIAERRQQRKKWNDAAKESEDPAEASGELPETGPDG